MVDPETAVELQLFIPPGEGVVALPQRSFRAVAKIRRDETGAANEGGVRCS